MINRVCGKGCFVIGSGIILAMLAGTSFGAALDFTIDSSQSTLTGSGTVGGAPINEQGPGSLVTTFNGTVNMVLDDALNPTSVTITNLSLDAVAQGPWLPGVGGTGAAALADVAGNVQGNSGGAQFLFNVALRNLLISGVTPSAVPAAGGQFTSTSLQFTVTSANLDYSGTVNGGPVFSTTSLAPQSTNNLAGAGSLTYSNNTATLTIPINFVLLKNISFFSFNFPVILTCSGALVATAPLPVNQPPVAVADLYVTDQDTPINDPAPGVLGNDTDAETDPLTAVQVGAAIFGTGTINSDGSLDYTPALNFSGIDLLTYHANDGTSDSADANVVIGVGANTPTGAVVNVQLDADLFGVDPLSVTFSDVTTAGSTTVTPLDPSLAGTVPGSYSIFSNLVFEIDTTAIATGPNDVCFTLTGVISSNDFVLLRVLHNEGGALVDRTTTSDFATQTLCAQVASLSPFAIALFEPAPPEPHNLAAISIKPPKTINLSEKHPSVTKPVKVQIQNLSDHSESITDLTMLGTLVPLDIESLGACPAATAVLVAPKKGFPVTLAPKKKLTVIYSVTFDCANDALKGAGHEDFRYSVIVNHAALDGAADTTPANDACPRDPLGNDKGCGAKKPDKTLGGEVRTDVVVKP